MATAAMGAIGSEGGSYGTSENWSHSAAGAALVLEKGADFVDWLHTIGADSSAKKVQNATDEAFKQTYDQK